MNHRCQMISLTETTFFPSACAWALEFSRTGPGFPFDTAASLNKCSGGCTVGAWGCKTDD